MSHRTQRLEEVFVTNERDDRTVVRGRHVFPPGEERAAVPSSQVFARELDLCAGLRVRKAPETLAPPLAEKH